MPLQFGRSFFHAKFCRHGETATYCLQMDRRRGRDLRVVHDYSRRYYRQHCYSSLADRFRCQFDECSVGADSLHAGTRSSYASHRISIPASWSETPLPARSCRVHHGLGSLWVLLELTHAHLLPGITRSNRRFYVTAGDYSTLDRIPPQRTWNCNGCPRSSHIARSSLWSNPWRLHCDLSRLAAHFLHQCTYRHPRNSL